MDVACFSRTECHEEGAGVPDGNRHTTDHLLAISLIGGSDNICVRSQVGEYNAKLLLDPLSSFRAAFLRIEARWKCTEIHRKQCIIIL